MSMEKDIFLGFLQELGPSEPQTLLKSFELFHSLLLEANAGLNYKEPPKFANRISLQKWS